MPNPRYLTPEELERMVEGEEVEDAEFYETNEQKRRRYAHIVAERMEHEMERQFHLSGSIDPDYVKSYILYLDARLGRPIGSRLSMEERIEHYSRVVRSTAPILHKERERVAKCKMKKRINTRLERMTRPAFFTQTFNDDRIPDSPSKYIDYWRKVFARLGIENWVLCTDYGEEYGRLHFHGYLDLPLALYEELKSLNDKKSGATTDHFRIDYILTKRITQRRVFTFVPFSPYGYNSISIINPDTEDVNKTLNYTTKYLLKDLEGLGLKHQLFASRTKRK